MSGQMKLSEQEQIDKYVEETDLYHKNVGFHYDMRKYSKYIKEHNLKAEDITQEILDMFWIA